MIKNELDLYKFIIVSAEKEGMFLYRIHDCGYTNPFDLGGIFCFNKKGIAIGIEVKYLDSVAQIDYQNLMSAKQEQWIKAFNELHGLGILFIQIKTEMFARLYLPKGFGKITDGQCVKVDRDKDFRYTGIINIFDIVE